MIEIGCCRFAITTFGMLGVGLERYPPRRWKAQVSVGFGSRMTFISSFSIFFKTIILYQLYEHHSEIFEHFHFQFGDSSDSGFQLLSDGAVFRYARGMYEGSPHAFLHPS